MLRKPLLASLSCLLTILGSRAARGDQVDNWLGLALAQVQQSGVDAPIALDRIALVEAAVFEAANAIEPLSKSVFADKPALRLPKPAPGASLDAAVASAAHDAMLALDPDQKAALDIALSQALRSVDDAQAREAGAEVGRRAAASVLRWRAHDGIDATMEWQQAPAAPGVYIAEQPPLGQAYGSARPWFLRSPSQFRPAAPPALSSATWASDLAELHALGRDAVGASPKMAQVAAYWNDTNALAVWIAVITQLSHQPGRSSVQNARLWARAAAVGTDALIGVYEAKYFYKFWRPTTALHAGSAGEPPDAGWQPFLPTPPTPEYPCAHCIISAALAEVLTAELGAAPAALADIALPEGRTFSSFPQIVEEVSNARVFCGAHYRNSTRVGNAMGQEIAQYDLKAAWPSLSTRTKVESRLQR